MGFLFLESLCSVYSGNDSSRKNAQFIYSASSAGSSFFTSAGFGAGAVFAFFGLGGLFL